MPDETLTCSTCHNEMPASARRCPHCGESHAEFDGEQFETSGTTTLKWIGIVLMVILFVVLSYLQLTGGGDFFTRPGMP